MMKPRKSEAEGLHWTAIFAMLGCALTSAYLVFAEGWNAMWAGFIVAGSCLAICGLLLAILWALSPPEERKGFVHDAMEIMRRDLDGFLAALRMRR